MIESFFNLFQAENPWEIENQLITSIDFAKQDDVIESLNTVNWDLVVVDEAHKMAAYRYGKKIFKISLTNWGNYYHIQQRIYYS